MPTYLGPTIILIIKYTLWWGGHVKYTQNFKILKKKSKHSEGQYVKYTKIFKTL